MLASALSDSHVGLDVTLNVAGTAVGGTLVSVRSFMGMVSLTIDTEQFLIDGDTDVTVIDADLRVAFLTEDDQDVRDVRLDLLETATRRR